MSASRKLSLFFVCFAAAFAPGLSSSRGAIVISDANRYARAESSPGATDEAPNTSSGVFEAHLSNGDSDTSVSASAAANQISDANPIILQGHGDASGSVTLLESEADFLSSSQSVYSVLFTVDTDGPYSFSASAKWTGDVAVFGGSVNVFIIDVASDDVILGVYDDADLQTPNSTTGELLLSAGVAYQLLADVKVESGGSFIGSTSAYGTWSFTLAPAESPAEVGAVPEPASVAIWCLGAISCAITGCRSRASTRKFRFMKESRCSAHPR